MIIVDAGELLIVITQPDHARFAGDLLALWRTDGLPDHPRRQALLTATREHDNGWQEADSAPWLDPEARLPYDYRTYPQEGRRDLWRRGILRFADDQPIVALLIAEHAEHLHQPLSRAWEELFEELEPLRERWHDRSGVDRVTIRQDYRFLELADALSLALCTRHTLELSRPGIQASVEGDLLRIDPFPLAGTTTFHIPVRKIENRPFDSDRDIAAALARARWSRWPVKVAAGPRERA